jgi:hypothetical protein
MPTPTPTGPGRPPDVPGEPAESQIQLRVQRSRKSAYVRAANRTNHTLAAWCFKHLDHAADYRPRTRPREP